MKTLYRSSGDKYTGSLLQSIDEHGRGKAAFQRTCYRCGGAGGSSKWDHTGHTCYACGGTGFGRSYTETIYTEEAFKKLTERRANLQEKRVAARNAINAAHKAAFDAAAKIFYDNHRELIADIEANRDHKFLGDLYMSLVMHGSLTEVQVSAAQRAIDQIKADADAQFVGNVGDTIEVELTTVLVRDISINGYPRIVRFIVLLKDAAGNLFKYVGNSNAVSYERGTTCKIKAKIKCHEEYKGRKQTIIERPRKV